MSLPVFSLFPYSKKGDPEAVNRIRNLVSNIKASRINVLDRYFDQHLNDQDRENLANFIYTGATLIPIPKSAPLLENATWPGRSICEMLLAKGLGISCAPILKRIVAVPKAAFQANSEERPAVQQHFDSIALIKDPLFTAQIKEIVLVDDVITQGRTAYACYQRLKENFPDVPIKLFTIFRTDPGSDMKDWNAPKETEILYYPQSGKTFHKLEPGPLGGLWS